MSYERLFVTFSLQRSGQHAVLNWICRQLQAESVIHFNHCGLFQRRSGLVKRQQYVVAEPRYGRFFVYSGDQPKDSGVLLKRSWIPRLRYRLALALARKTRHAVFSFEGTDLSQDVTRGLPPHRTLTAVVIVRDPFNWVASFLQNGHPLELLPERIRVWKQHVRECLGETNLLGLPLVDVDFNRWTQEASFRAELARRLAIPYSERGVDEVSPIGGGSSFDRTAFDGIGSHMQVLDRWSKFRENPHFLRVAEDPEIRELSRSYFGFDDPDQISMSATRRGEN